MGNQEDFIVVKSELDFEHEYSAFKGDLGRVYSSAKGLRRSSEMRNMGAHGSGKSESKTKTLGEATYVDL